MYKISIIIPVYNTEAYLKKCLESIITQTYRNIEIIIINDGSTDNSREICEHYSKLDNRIIFINNDNHGVSYSRNVGIDYSTGEYILFIDSDDYVDICYVENLIKKIEDVELVICNINDVYIANNKVITRKIEGNLTKRFYDDFYILRNLLRGPVAKLYKAEIIKRNNIYFPLDIDVGEDQIFNFSYYGYVCRYIFLDKGLYYYRHEDRESLSSLRTEKVFLGAITKIIKEYEFISKYKIVYGNKMVLESIYRLILNFCIKNINKTSFIDFRKNLMKINKKIDIKILNDENLNKKEYIFFNLMKYKCYRIIYIYCLFKFYYLKFRGS